MLQVDGFADMFIHPRCQAQIPISPGRVCRHCHNGQCREPRVCADTPCGLKTIDIGHLHVHQHNVEHLGTVEHLIDAFNTAFCKPNTGTLAAEQRLGNLPIDHIVFDNQ